MTATATTYQRISPPGQFPTIAAIILIAAVAAGSIFAVQLGYHANKHSDAEWVRECLKQNGTLQLWQIGNSNKFYRVCTDNQGHYGIQAVIREGEDIWNEITAFGKNKMHTIEKVMQYLKNCGATRIW